MNPEKIAQIKEELEALGFEFKYEHSDHEVRYEVFEYRLDPNEEEHIEVTINHTDSTLWYNIQMEDELPFTSAKDIFKLTRILSKGKKLKTELLTIKTENNE